MTNYLSTDLCIIGAGPGGLSVAAAASHMGVKTILIEKHLMGGDCLNFGCVPSKALLSVGKHAELIRRSRNYGIETEPPNIEFSKVFEYIHNAISSLEPNDSIERFEGLGVKVIKGLAKFQSENVVEVGGFEIEAKKFVISSGSKNCRPPIDGLDSVQYLTNKTIFKGDINPEHLVIIGGGVSGVEIGQAFANLGVKVSIIDISELLASEDPEFSDIIRKTLKRLGVKIFENTLIQKVEKMPTGVAVHIQKNGSSEVLSGTHLLVCVGKKPNVEELNLGLAGISYSESGIKVDSRLRTTNKKVFAIGDVIGQPMFTHLAAYHAEVVIKNILFFLPARINGKVLPRVVFTTPEIAQVGLTEKQSREKYARIRILRWPYFENDRAQIEGATRGFIKVITSSRGKILGAGLVGKSASELIQMWVLAIENNLKIGAISKMLYPYPTLSEISKRAAGGFFITRLFSNTTKILVKFLSRFR